MEIKIGKMAGFCGGVKRSVLLAEEKLKDRSKVYCFGEIVHNKQVTNKLEKDGLVIIDDINSVPDNEMVIFRAHGVEKNIYDIAESKGLEVVDLTCPKVLMIHNFAEELVNDGYFIVLIAQVTHPETIGTISFCGENSFILENSSMIDELRKKVEKSNIKKIAIISQTTFSVDKYNSLVNLIKETFKGYELNINNNICDATELRQKEMKELASEVEIMIVIGGKNSSNTNKLYDIGVNVCDKCLIIETVDDLDFDFTEYKKIGIMAGASTPQKSIDDVVKYLQTLSN